MNNLVDTIVDLQDYIQKAKELAQNMNLEGLFAEINKDTEVEKVYSYSSNLPAEEESKNLLKEWANYFLTKYSGESYREGSYAADNNIVFTGELYNNLVKLNTGSGAHHQYLYGTINLDYDNFKKAYLALIEDFNNKIEDSMRQLQEGLVNNVSLTNGNKKIIIFSEDEDGNLVITSPVYDDEELSYTIPEEFVNYYQKIKEGKERLVAVQYLNSKSPVNVKQPIHLIVEVE